MKVVFIVLDCVRYDHFGCNGNDKIYTPTIDRLAGRGCNFHKHFSAAPWTSPAVASLLSGIYPHRLGMFKNHQSFPDNVKSIFKYYKEKNKPVASFVKSKNFFGEDSEANEAGYSWELPKMLRWLERNNDQDYFLYLHYWNTHTPYFTKYSKQAWYDGMRKLLELIKTGKEEGIQKAKNLYRAAIERASEEFIYAIVEKLDKLNSLEDCLIIITSDHGESWGGRLENIENIDLFGMHGKSLYDEVIHIPLIIHGKDIPSGRKISAITRSIDLFPTLLEYTNSAVDTSGKYLQIDGKSLWPIITGKDSIDRECFISTTYLDKMQELVINEIIQKFAVRDKEWKIIYNQVKGTFEFYNIIKDTGEKKDLKNSKKKKFSEYQKKLNHYLKTSDFSIGGEDKKVLMQKLKNLGYI